MTSFSQTSLDDSTATLPNTDRPANNTFHNMIITVEEVRSVLQTLKLGKSSGPDNRYNRILKEIAYPISKPLCDFFNYSLSHCIFPDVWKQANLSPLYKKVTLLWYVIIDQYFSLVRLVKLLKNSSYAYV